MAATQDAELICLFPGRVRTCRPGPPSAPPGLKLWPPSQTKLLGSPAVSGGRGRQWLVLCKSILNLLHSVLGLSRPAYHPPWKLSMQDQPKSERSWSVAPIQAPRTAPVNKGFISTLLWMPWLGPGPGGGLFWGLRSPPVDHSSLPMSQQICVIPIAMDVYLCFNDGMIAAWIER
eukprot:1156449-Pelagomonas_calceolata.AAC.8